MRIFIQIGILAMMVIGFVSETALAEGVRERVDEIKLWREQCNDPDLDLRMAYVEAAVKSEDVIIQRICVRQALESDNADIRNLGLRAAISSLKQISFQVSIPTAVKEAYENAADDQRKLRDLDKQKPLALYEFLKPNLVFEIKDVQITRGASSWYSLAGLTSSHPNHKGDTVIIGESLNWVGSIGYPDGRYQLPCVLNVHLDTGGGLLGELKCQNYEVIPVASKLM